MEIATLAGGCFWCTEAIFSRLNGVTQVTPGYIGGMSDHPTYEQICTGKTGHAEAIQIEFDPEQISYKTLLEVFFATHDPTTLNRQGNDVGAQYRSAIFYHSAEQKKTAEQTIEIQNKEGRYQFPIVTEVVPATTFFQAEEYHKKYFEKNKYQPYCQVVIEPKIQTLLKNYQHLVD